MLSNLAAKLGGFRRPKPDTAAVARVKAWALAALDLPEVSLAVNEIVCADPSCPGTETIVLIMVPGRKTRACRIGKLLDEVTEQDLREALVA